MAEQETSKKAGRYAFSDIEARWQAYWSEHGTFRTLNPGDAGFDDSKPKYYALDMFPYPSGAGLHVGHPLGYCATDIICRYKRMRGFNVLHPMGFDAFGLPAEQYAIQHNVHPADTTAKNIENYRRQLRMFGFSYDWEREVSTCVPEYYKHTQWIFLQMFESWYDEHCTWTDPQGKQTVGKARPISELVAEFESANWGVNPALHLVRRKDAANRIEWTNLSQQQRRRVIDNQRLAFIDEVPVNWCPALGTVLANEEVDAEGRSERGSHPVYRKPLRQWNLRITRYCERLIDDLDTLDWPEPIKLMQRNWIGKSTGAEVVFPLAEAWTQGENGSWQHRDPSVVGEHPLSVDHFPDSIKVYTTRPDTLFGATYMVLAPEHPLVDKLTTEDQRTAVEEYVQAARNRSDLERTADTKSKTGVFTGAYAINPVDGKQVPIWIADYVLMGYGTGAIMAVPGHDSRDFEFARAFDLPVIPVVQPVDEWFVEMFKTNVVDEAACEKVGLDVRAARNAAKSGDLAAVKDAYLNDPGIFNASFDGAGVGLNSPPAGEGQHLRDACDLNGQPTPEAKRKITGWLEDKGVGQGAVNYKLRDWIFSRQKYWGEPFPIVHSDDDETRGVPEADLPVELPPMDDFKPKAGQDENSVPEPPLGRAKVWTRVELDGRAYKRDLNTMPQWAGSCWYYLRFIDPHNERRFCGKTAENYWMPVDLYVGGAEHAVLHLLYARFWHKLLLDLGHVTTREPFQKLFNQGMIQSFAYENKLGTRFTPDEVEERGQDEFFLKETGEPVKRIVAKMSKSLKNVVNPDEIINEYGADTFRLYEMYMGPLDAAKPWNTRDVPGLFKLCQRIWRLVIDEYTGELSSSLTDTEPDRETVRVLHQTIKRVTEDLEQLKMNTAIAGLFEMVNVLTPMEQRPRSVVETFVLLLSPFAPHLAEELWRRLGHRDTIAYEPWPAFDAELAKEDEVEVAVQVLGKIKARITVPADADQATMERIAMEDGEVQKAIEGKTVRKVIVVPGRLVNIVAN